MFINLLQTPKLIFLVVICSVGAFKHLAEPDPDFRPWLPKRTMGFWLGEGTEKEHFGNPDLKYLIPEIAMEDLEDWLFSDFDQYKYVGFVVDESWSCKLLI